MKNPPTSAPTNGSPATLIERSMGTEAAKWSQAALLSPVHMAPEGGCIKVESHTECD